MRWPSALFLALLAAPLLAPSDFARGDAIERLRGERLRAVHEAVEVLKAERRPVDLPPGKYTDYRAFLHVHSHFSHDSRGQIDEILEAARKCDARVIMFSEHPADHYDYVQDGHQGLKDDILVIPGAETEGFLAYPTVSIQGEKTAGPQQFADLVKRDEGLVFLCHLEERMDWQIAGLTGSEIYNTHADAMEEKRFLAMLRNPLLLLGLVPLVQKYPQECFGAILDYPADYLRRFDELCQQSPHTGVSANDAHHNQGIRAVLTDDEQIQVIDRLGEEVARLDPKKIPLLAGLTRNKQPGDTILELDLDPYERSFRHVSTHLLMPELTKEAVWEALRSGRAYVAFDWLCDPTGFAFYARQGDDGERLEMGSQIELADGKGVGSLFPQSDDAQAAESPPEKTPDPFSDKRSTLRFEMAAPLAGIVKLVRNGEVVKEDRAAKLQFPVSEPGVYRLEIWLPVAGELKPWILSNPIYVRAAKDETR